MKKFECSCLLNIWLLVELEEADEDEALDTLLNMPLKDLLKEKVESFDLVDWTLKEVENPNKVCRKRLTIAGYER